MKHFLAAVIFLAIAQPNVCVAQKLPQPILDYSRLPQYPPLAIEARLEGTVTLSFVLNDKGEVSDVQVISGTKLLADKSVEIVKSWRFSLPHDLFRTEWRYETEFVYRFSGNEVAARPKLTVSFESFEHVEVISDKVKPMIQY